MKIFFNGKGLQEEQRHDDVEFKNRFLKGFHLKISYFSIISRFSIFHYSFKILSILS